MDLRCKIQVGKTLQGGKPIYYQSLLPFYILLAALLHLMEAWIPQDHLGLYIARLQPVPWAPLQPLFPGPRAIMHGGDWASAYKRRDYDEKVNVYVDFL